MPHSLIISEKATVDIEKAYKWYDDIRPELGERFLNVLREYLTAIQEHPLICAQVFETARRIKISPFPYHVYYRVHDAHIKILAVIHTSRNPAIIKRRLSK